MPSARSLALLLSLSMASLAACHAGARHDTPPPAESPTPGAPATMEASVDLPDRRDVSAPAIETATAPPASPSAGAHVLVLKDGRRIDCLEAPVIGMGRVMYKSSDGVTHAISDQIVDTQATRLQPAPAPVSKPSVSATQVAASGASSGSASGSASERPPVPDFEAVRPDGTKVRLSDLKGKVVLVDFWATWCGPCIREMPHVKAAYAKLGGPNFEILGVSLDQDRERMNAYVEEQGLAWPQYFDGKGWGNTVARAWGVNSIPAAVLLDKQGKVAKVGLRGSDLEFAVAELVAK